MSVLSDRMKARIAAAGELVYFTKLAGIDPPTPDPAPVSAIVAALDIGTMRTYLDDVEVMGVVRPGLKLVLAGDSTVIAADVFTREGRSFEVLKIMNQTISNVVVAKVAVCA